MKNTHKTEISDYRTFLKQAFEKKLSLNSHYSLRAFARDLEMTPAQLSFVLSEKRNLSLKSASKVARNIGLSAEQTDLFCSLVSVETARSQTSKEIAKTRLAQAQAKEEGSYSIGLDAFRVISDWYHFAILQLMRIKQYQENESWIAARLGIQREEVKPAIARLVRLELCEWNASQRRHVTSQDVVFAPNGVPSEAIRKFHRQCIEKALVAMDSKPLSERYLDTSILPIRRDQMDSARKSIKNFQRNFMKKYETGRNFDDVVCLSIQFFNLLNEERT